MRTSHLILLFCAFQWLSSTCLENLLLKGIKINRKMELNARSITSEPAPPTNNTEEEKMEVASELNSPTMHSGNSGFIERGIKTMLSFRKSRRSLSIEKGKEGTGTWKRKLSWRFSKSSEENETTICNGVEVISEKIEAESIQGKPLSGKKQKHHCNLLGRVYVNFKQFALCKTWAQQGCWRTRPPMTWQR